MYRFSNISTIMEECSGYLDVWIPSSLHSVCPQETEEVKAPEARAPRRGRSSRAGPEGAEEGEEEEVEEEVKEEEETPPKEVEKKAETPTRGGRRPANQAQDTTASTSTTTTSKGLHIKRLATLLGTRNHD